MMRRNLVSFVAAMAVVTLFHDAHATEKSDDSVTGLYMQLEMTGGGGRGPFSSVNSTSKNYLYLFPDGTFYEGFVLEGYDEFDLAKHLSYQHPLRVAKDTGRYAVNGNQVTFRYAGGGEIVRNREGNMLDPGLGQYVRVPNCDGLKLSGTYNPAGFGMGIMFTPDGRFIDHGIMPVILTSRYSRPDSPADTLRPGPGTYSIKNHTLTLRYAYGPVFRFFFAVKVDERGDIDPGTIYIDITDFFRQDPPPSLAAVLPKVGVPPGWKIQWDGTNKNLTYVVPPGNLPLGESLTVMVHDPESLRNHDVTASPGRFHDAVVQEVVKKLTAQGFRTETAMRRDAQGKILSSTGMVAKPDGKKLWMTFFTPMSTSEGQLVVYSAEREDVYKATLPTVKAMLGEGDASLQAGMTSLDALLAKAPLKVHAASGWKSEYDPNDKSTQFTPPNLPVGQVVFVRVGEREKMAASLSQSHDETVRSGQADLEREKWRLEGSMKKEQRDNTLVSSMVYVLPNGMRAWVTFVSTAVGSEEQAMVLVASSEDLQKRYLPTVHAMLAEIGRH